MAKTDPWCVSRSRAMIKVLCYMNAIRYVLAGKNTFGSWLVDTPNRQLIATRWKELFRAFVNFAVSHLSSHIILKNSFGFTDLGQQMKRGVNDVKWATQ